ncbi:glycosyltransferase family 4 protein [Candidatus Roizmanbacteria bacterium]|nr:MAG: glycosyltransferase family 4 protein [Candidatus Roizmanbacteria bacterium]
MKILIVSLLKRPVTPTIPASRPRVIYDLVSGLIRKGHDVTILGTGDSDVPGARIIPVVSKALSELPPFENTFYAHTAMLTLLADKLREIGNDFDIIHNHTYPEFLPLLIAKDVQKPIVTTIHGQVFPEFDQAFSLFDNQSHLISISEAHKKLFKHTVIYDVVHNGIDTDLYAYQEKKDDYLLWLGRLSAAKDADGRYQDPKGIRWAIELAEKTNSRLLLSGNVEDMKFYKQDVEPHLSDRIKWIGPVSNELSLSKPEVVKLMQNAKAFLMTINWYEPFGLVMAESMSCGTPVIGFDRGSVSEVIENGKTGFVVNPDDGIQGLVKAYERLSEISPADCRSRVEKHFSLQSMVEGYEQVYKKILAK